MVTFRGTSDVGLKVLGGVIVRQMKSYKKQISGQFNRDVQCTNLDLHMGSHEPADKLVVVYGELAFPVDVALWAKFARRRVPGHQVRRHRGDRTLRQADVLPRVPVFERHRDLPQEGHPQQRLCRRRTLLGQCLDSVVRIRRHDAIEHGAGEQLPE